MEESYLGLKISGKNCKKKIKERKDGRIVNHKHVLSPKLETLSQKWGVVHYGTLK